MLENCQNTPEWLTKEYIQEKLRIYYKDPSLEVISINLRPAIGKGENYSGVLLRATVQYKQHGARDPKTESYIIKSSLEYGDNASAIEPYDLINKEMSIYERILPKLTALLEEAGDKEKLFPDTIAVDYDHSTIIFEDLAERKFTMYDRLKGLDIEHTKMCLKKLAKMHATSAVLNEREPGTFVSYDRGFFNRHTDNFRSFFVLVLDACGRQVSKWKGFEEYGRKLLALKPKVMEYGAQAFDVIEGELNVLAHGDLWINNVMFSYNDKNQLYDAILIDFQYSCWGSPVNDFHYFFNTSLEEELRLNHQEELIQHYYGVFTKTLKALDFRGQIPSLHRFQISVAERGFYGFISACLMQPLLINENPDETGFDVVIGEDERSKRFKNSLYENVKVQGNLKNLLPMYDKKGLLDIRDYELCK